MKQEELKQLSAALSAFCVFRGLLTLEPVKALRACLDCEEGIQKNIGLYGNFVYSLAPYDYCFSDFLLQAVYTDENRYIICTAEKKEIAEPVRSNAERELSVLSALTCLTTEDLIKTDSYAGYLPAFTNQRTDISAIYRERLAHIDQYGYGIFAAARMFSVSGGAICPVEAPDDVSADQFIGYEEERKQVFENTKALIEGRPAANVLLCGDAGTGKSSTVKACANAFYAQGVRLIELRKDQLLSLSYVMGKIAKQPLKFIIFIDDLSFNKNDDSFSMLKAALEGSASAKADNAVIYATSNRRHIIKEQFSDRETSDDVHHNDTMQELLSLSDRFGLVVYFSRPNKALYLEIVHRLAEKYRIAMPPEELDRKAEAFALARGSRTPRGAEQFIHGLL